MEFVGSHPPARKPADSEWAGVRHIALNVKETLSLKDEAEEEANKQQEATKEKEEEEEEQGNVFQQQEYVLLLYQHTPRFLRTPFILSGYRSYFPFRLIALSFFRLHNESVNVWTHVAGLLYFGYRAVHMLSDRPSSFSKTDSMSLLVFYFTAALCMLLSALFHLVGCHSAQLHVTLYRFDLIGICLLVLGSYVAGLYWGFYCRPFIQCCYLGTVSSLLLVMMVLITSKRFGTQKYHSYRVALLVTVVVFSLLPIFHWGRIVSLQQLSESMWGVLSMLLLYLAGFGFYWTQVPEKCRPGAFDIWGSSHQLWHVFVFLAAAVWDHTLWGYARLTLGVPCTV